LGASIAGDGPSRSASGTRQPLAGGSAAGAQFPLHNTLGAPPGRVAPGFGNREIPLAGAPAGAQVQLAEHIRKGVSSLLRFHLVLGFVGTVAEFRAYLQGQRAAELAFRARRSGHAA
jgi:hypothetical protein